MKLRLVLFLLLAFALPAPAQQTAAPALLVGVAERPPYAIRTRDGAWMGLAVDIRRLAADQRGWSFSLVPIDSASTTEALRSGTVDLVLAVDATPAREAELDFTYPLHTATMGIAAENRNRILSVIEGFLTWQFLRLILWLSALLLAVGALIWLLERRRNTDQFATRPLRGLGDGFWWAGVTLTTIGYGDKAPITLAGRAVAMLWMLAGLAVSSALTATIVTLADIRERADVPETFEGRTVGVVSGSSTAAFLEAEQVDIQRFENVTGALRAMEASSLDLVAAAAPVLKSAIDGSGAFDMTVRTTTRDPQLVSIALPEGSALREPLNAEILRRMSNESGWNLLNRYLPE